MTKLAYKLLIFCYFIATQNISFTQTNSTHKLQMGIILGSGLNFNKMNTKLAESKMGTDLSIGMNIIKNFSDNLGFISGFEFDFSRINYTFIDTVFYEYTDSKILNKSDNHTSSSVFKINERKQTPIYLSIPTMFVFRTDYMGYNRYFAKFGMRHSIALKSTTTDNGVILESKEQKELSNMELSSDLRLYRGSIGISCGTEWNYYGTSTIVFELGYFYGINNIHRGDAIVGDVDKNKSIYENISKTSYITLKNTQNQLAFKVSFLF
jgi:hypothetical protein